MAAPPTTAAAQPPSSGTMMKRASSRWRCRMNSSAGVESIAPPVGRRRIIADRDDVEAAGARGEPRMIGEKRAGCAHQLRTLGGRDGVDAVAETAGTPV